MSRASHILSLFEVVKKGKPMLTISELRNFASQIDKKQGEPRPVSIISTNPILANKTLTIKAEARGTKVYTLVMVFYNVDYDLTGDAEHPLRVRPKFGEPFFMKPASESINPVQVRCSCPFFRFAWSYWDKQEKALSGPAFAAYIRKTTTRPEVNSQHLPGICKHLIGLAARLGKDKILTP